MDAVVSLIKGMEFEKFIPSLGFYLFSMKFWCFVLVMAGPVVVLALGILYTKRPPETPDSFWSYRTKAAMRDRQSWNEAHRIAGKAWSRLGWAMCVPGLVVSFFVFVLPGNISAVLTLLAVVVELVLIAGGRSKIDKQLKNV